MGASYLSALVWLLPLLTRCQAWLESTTKPTDVSMTPNARLRENNPLRHGPAKRPSLPCLSISAASRNKPSQIFPMQSALLPLAARTSSRPVVMNYTNVRIWVNLLERPKSAGAPKRKSSMRWAAPNPVSNTAATTTRLLHFLSCLMVTPLHIGVQ